MGTAVDLWDAICLLNRLCCLDTTLMQSREAEDMNFRLGCYWCQPWAGQSLSSRDFALPQSPW